MENNKAVIYARFSNGPRQTEQSIEGQVADCTAYAERNGLVVIDVYADKHVSGTSTEGRTEFLRMVDDAKKGKFSAVIVWKIDRFGRDRRDIAIYKHQLKSAGVTLHYAAESIPDGPEGILLESLMEGLAEYYSADLRQKVERGMRESIKKGQYPGKLPFGYTKNDKKIPIVDKPSAEIVKEIFTLHCADKSTTEISRILANKGIKQSEGGIYRILNNRAYTGKLSILGMEIEVEPIISAEIFEESLTHFKTTGSRKSNTSVNYLLSGKCRCGKCDSNVIGLSAHGKSGKIFAYYQCNKKCYKAINATKLEDKVLHEIMENVLNDEMIGRIVDRIMELQEQEANDNATLTSLTAKLADIRNKKANLIKAIENGLYSPEMNARMEELSAEEESISLLITKESATKPIIPREYIESWLISFKSGNILDEEFCKKLIRTFVAEVIVYSDYAVVICNATGTNGDRCSSSIPLVNLTNRYSNTSQMKVCLPYILLWIDL